MRSLILFLRPPLALPFQVDLDDKSKRIVCGTAAFIAPEVLRQEGFGVNADVWSLGGTVIQMVTSLHPWHERRFESAIDLMQFVAVQQDEYVNNTVTDRCTCNT